MFGGVKLTNLSHKRQVKLGYTDDFLLEANKENVEIHKRFIFGRVSLMERLLHPEIENAFFEIDTKKHGYGYRYYVNMTNMFRYFFVLISSEIG